MGDPEFAAQKPDAMIGANCWRDRNVIPTDEHQYWRDAKCHPAAGAAQHLSWRNACAVRNRRDASATARHPSVGRRFATDPANVLV
jgi:hypothetical protein